MEIYGKSGGGKPLFARWTTDFDCGYETNWWYVIKNEPFDVDSLKAKRRYEINKGRKNFIIKKIDAGEYAEALFEVQVSAYSQWPKKYRPTVDHDMFVNDCSKWTAVVLGAFHNDVLCGYTISSTRDRCIDFSVMRVNPKNESQGVNAALVDGLLSYYANELGKGKYICDGSRSVSHETHFQDYLEKYFGFRKAYCQLHIVYRNPFGLAVKILHPFRRLLKKMDNIRIFHQINAVLAMNEIIRKG